MPGMLLENVFSGKEGFLKLVKIGDFLGVISEEEFQAVQLQREIFANTEWETGAPLPADKDLKTYIKNLFNRNKVLFMDVFHVKTFSSRVF